MPYKAEFQRCTATCRNGSRCRNKCVTTSDGTVLAECWFHAEHPEVLALREQARSRGGKRGKHSVPIDLRQALGAKGSTDALVAVLSGTLTALVNDTIPSRQASAIASVGSCLLRTLEQRDLADKLTELEQVAAGQSSPEALTAILQEAGK